MKKLLIIILLFTGTVHAQTITAVQFKKSLDSVRAIGTAQYNSFPGLDTLTVLAYIKTYLKNLIKN